MGTDIRRKPIYSKEFVCGNWNAKMDIVGSRKENTDMSIFCPVKGAKTVYLECHDCDKECEYFQCLIVGSRYFTDYDFFKEKVENILQNKNKICIISGGARGTDSLAERFAKEKGYCFRKFEADWTTYGKSAGYLRNKRMHEYISNFTDRGVIAFWNGNKKSGTAHSFDLAKEYSNPIRVIRIDTLTTKN